MLSCKAVCMKSPAILRSRERIVAELRAMDMGLDLGRLARQRRTSLGLSPERLAELAQVTARDVDMLECGEARAVTVAQVLSVMAALGLEFSVSTGTATG